MWGGGGNPSDGVNNPYDFRAQDEKNKKSEFDQTIIEKLKCVTDELGGEVIKRVISKTASFIFDVTVGTLTRFVYVYDDENGRTAQKYDDAKPVGEDGHGRISDAALYTAETGYVTYETPEGKWMASNSEDRNHKPNRWVRRFYRNESGEVVQDRNGNANYDDKEETYATNEEILSAAFLGALADSTVGLVISFHKCVLPEGDSSSR
jgi:hypothetical protein